MTSPTKDHVLERFNPGFQAKPDHMRDPLSQFVLDLLELEVTAPVIIPVKHQSKLPAQMIFLKSPKVNNRVTLVSVRFSWPLFSAARVSGSCRNSSTHSRSRRAAGQSACRGPTSETANKDRIIRLGEDLRLEVRLQIEQKSFVFSTFRSVEGSYQLFLLEIRDSLSSVSLLKSGVSYQPTPACPR